MGWEGCARQGALSWRPGLPPGGGGWVGQPPVGAGFRVILVWRARRWLWRCSWWQRGWGAVQRWCSELRVLGTWFVGFCLIPLPRAHHHSHRVSHRRDLVCEKWTLGHRDVGSGSYCVKNGRRPGGASCGWRL
jgi:hypothetical protein